MKLTNQNNEEYSKFIAQIKDRILSAQYEALKAVNKELIKLYWDIGNMINEKQEQSDWGKSVVENLAKNLQKEFVGVKGFSAANMWRMRNFYLTYNKNVKLAPLVREISWAKNIAIMEKCKDDLQKEFYIKMTKKFGWTKNVLIHQIETQAYEKFLINQTNFDDKLPAEMQAQAKLAVKDQYTFDFLELGDEFAERELESRLVEHVKKTLQEFGGYFSFIGSQFRLEVGEQEFFIDLVLFHRQLNCLVAIEIKTGEFKPEYAGKIQFYLSALDDQTRLTDENPSIGIIICKDKNRTLVEYTLKDVSKPIGVASYKVYKSLPEEFKTLLPSIEEIESQLNEL